jgi:glutaredoxin 3
VEQPDGRARGAGRTAGGLPPNAIFPEAMTNITLYTTDSCVYCRHAKALLAQRGVPYTEVNLDRDPEGRAELLRHTGMMTFPQVVIDGRLIGGFQELARADRAGELQRLLAA